ncbi:spermidine synthase [Taibaiella soli]|nr:fused MFS/spermidine synthase [Taibaiella soli]
MFQKLLSYVYPVRVESRSSEINPVLDLFMYRGQWQLATSDALYSDGDRYRPLVVAFKKMKRHLPEVKTVLVLGTGLGSAARILHKVGNRALTTLVDIDEEVLQWALELMPEEIACHSRPVCSDAVSFLEENKEVYDLLIVDIFISRVVPDFVITEIFLKKCRQRINTGGHFIMNYIVNDEREWDTLQGRLMNIFPDPEVILNGINRIVVAHF